jgi:hypothetical protein
MPAILHWSFSKLLLVCAAWIIVSVTLLVALTVTWFLSVTRSANAGSGGVGAVSIGLMPAAFIVVSVLPVLTLITLWAVQRVQKGRATGSRV